MSINNITQEAGRLGPNRKRLGRGIGSGQGKTSGRGHKGAGSRSGTKRRLAHEGGQMPLFRKVAKRGFSAGDSSILKYVAVVNIGQIDELENVSGVVDCELLIVLGLVPRRTRSLRVLGGGEITKPVVVRANYITRSAVEKLCSAGGKAELV
ncbi:MAG: 50S ribosomal protein L15 [Planctomycetia bacterium]|nr:50S ribosomal protein L15 [Planctomycetia bacterium]